MLNTYYSSGGKGGGRGEEEESKIQHYYPGKPFFEYFQ